MDEVLRSRVAMHGSLGRVPPAAPLFPTVGGPALSSLETGQNGANLLELGLSPFGVGSARGMGPREMARQHPGALLQSALAQMRTYDATRADPYGSLEGSFQKYLVTILLAKHSESQMGQRNARELRTLALCLDTLLTGNVAGAADILVQRWKAVETAVQEGGWQLARHHELLPFQDVGLSNDAERTVVARAELERVRLEEASKKVVDRSRAPPAATAEPRGG